MATCAGNGKPSPTSHHLARKPKPCPADPVGGWTSAPRVDGDPDPPDFAEGSSLPEIASLLASLRRQHGCDVATWAIRAEVTRITLLPGASGSPFSSRQVWDGLLHFEATTPDSQGTVGLGVYVESIVGVELWSEAGELALLPVRGEGTAISISTQPFSAFDTITLSAPGVPAVVASSNGGEQLTTASLHIELQDDDGLVLDDDRLPRVPPPIGELERNGGSLLVSLDDGGARVELFVTVISAEYDAF